MKVGNSVYHICEYAELLEANGGKCIPEPEVNLKCSAWQLGSREYLTLERSENGFRYKVLTRDFPAKNAGVAGSALLVSHSGKGIYSGYDRPKLQKPDAERISGQRQRQ